MWNFLFGFSSYSLVLLVLGTITTLVVFFLVWYERQIPEWEITGSYFFIGRVLALLMVLDHTYALERLRLGEQKGKDEHTRGFRLSALYHGNRADSDFRLGSFPTSSAEGRTLLLQNAVGILEGILATLTGFYFGGKGGLKIRGGGER